MPESLHGVGGNDSQQRRRNERAPDRGTHNDGQTKCTHELVAGRSSPAELMGSDKKVDEPSNQQLAHPSPFATYYINRLRTPP